MDPDGTFETLREELRGRVIRPGDPGFEQERELFNAMIQTKPAAIARVEGSEDTVASIRFARDHDLRLGVRAGGHSVAGHSLVQDGLVIDVRSLNSIEIDPERRIARVGAGVTWGAFDRACQAHGLATTGGRQTTTGVAGYTLGGGNGWLDRTFGLAVDNLLSVELVTTDGRRVTASADENPDLFWALRGGGGNFGVVTSFTFRLHAVGLVYAGRMLFDAERAGERVTRTYRDLMEDAPRELGGGLLWFHAPEAETIPEHLRNHLVTGIAFCFVGDPTEGERLAEPLRALKPEIDTVGLVPYTEFNGGADDPAGLRNYWTAEYLSSFDGRVLDVYVEHSSNVPPATNIQSAILPWGGTVADVDDDETPLASRRAPWHMLAFCQWQLPEDDERCMNWGRRIRDALEPFSTGGVYLNFISDEGQERVLAAYGRKNFERLARIKGEWDPDNVFRGNQNIRPRHR